MSTDAQLDTETIESPAEIEREIERTRERMTTNLDELGERLRPGNLKRQASQALTERLLDRLTAALQAIVRNPLPAVAVTLGVLSLLVRRRERRV
jgi:hypothetical protein